jgi:hypothetical protein
MLKMKNSKSFYRDTNMSEVKTCPIIVSPKHHRGRLIICNRILPCPYHGEITLKLQKEKEDMSKKKQEDKSIVIGGLVFDFAS